MAELYSYSRGGQDSGPVSARSFIVFSHVSSVKFGLMLRPSAKYRPSIFLLSPCCGELLAYLTTPEDLTQCEMLKPWEVELMWPRLQPGFWCCDACRKPVPNPPRELWVTGEGPIVWNVNLSSEVVSAWLDAHGVGPLEAELAAAEAVFQVEAAHRAALLLEPAYPGSVEPERLALFVDELVLDLQGKEQS